MISQTSEYALRAIIFLAHRAPEGAASAQEIADATRVPVGYLQKVLRTLARAGILTAQRGAGGGFSLARLPSSISVLDVLTVTETSAGRIERCPLGIENHRTLCKLHRLLDEELAHAQRTFSSVSIAELVEGADTRPPLCEPGGGGAHTPRPVRRAPQT